MGPMRGRFAGIIGIPRSGPIGTWTFLPPTVTGTAGVSFGILKVIFDNFAAASELF
jgi:hypothetical protein